MEIVDFRWIRQALFFVDCCHYAPPSRGFETAFTDRADRVPAHRARPAYGCDCSVSIRVGPQLIKRNDEILRLLCNFLLIIRSGRARVHTLARVDAAICAGEWQFRAQAGPDPRAVEEEPTVECFQAVLEAGQAGAAE
jgi:hypothetical protein